MLARMEAVIKRKAEADVPASTPNRDAVVAEVQVKLCRRAEEGARGYLFGDFPISLYRALRSRLRRFCPTLGATIAA